MINKNWNAEDEKCPYCNSVIKKARGFNKQNLKNLCFSKPSLQQIIIFIMIILCLLLSYAHQVEIDYYKEIINNPAELCFVYNPSPSSNPIIDLGEINFSEFAND